MTSDLNKFKVNLEAILVQAVITKYHRLRDLNNRQLFLTVLTAG